MIQPVYSWFNELLQEMTAHQELSFDVIHLVGSRSSGKTVAAMEFLCNACDLVDEKSNPIISSAYVLRKEQQDVGEMWDQYQQGLEQIEAQPYVLKSERRWEFPNGSMIKFKGLARRDKNKVIGAGQAAATGEYVITVYEEAFEYSDRDRSWFNQAVRGNNPNCKYLEINICNPWYPQSIYLKNCIKWSPFDEYQLRTNGYQWKIVEIPTPSGRIERHLFFYTNWRAIKNILPQWKIDSILATYVNDPINAKCADIGVPSYQAGSVYADLLENVQEPVWYAHRYVCGGGDIGVGHSTKSGMTSFLFCGIDPDGYIDIYSEYVWDNKKINKDGYVLAEEVIKFYINNYNRYIQNTGVIPESVNVKVDNSEQAFIDILNNRAIEFGVDNWLSFTACSKYQIIDRIHITRYILSNQRLRISQDCSNFLDELALSRWDERATAKLKRIDDNDHSINAFEYAIEDFMYDFIAPQDTIDIGKKLSQSGRKKIYL